MIYIWGLILGMTFSAQALSPRSPTMYTMPNNVIDRKIKSVFSRVRLLSKMRVFKYIFLLRDFHGGESLIVGECRTVVVFNLNLENFKKPL
jgi:hypothetical protein